MRLLVFIMSISLLFACNSSRKKDPNKAMDDTARMRNPPVITQDFPVMRVTKTDIPSEIKIRGDVAEVWKWKDQLGDNIFFTTTVAPYADKDPKYDEEGETAELHAYHYIGTEGKYKQLWQINELEKACPFDITSEFVRNAISITDLDKNGIAEITIVYRMACRSDVSPSTMKLIMHEDEAKYVLKGLSWYGMGDTKFDVTVDNANLEKLPGYIGTDEDIVKAFGRYETEKEFVNAPPAFLSFAREQWIKHIKESLE
jgi:hypothetical protein